MLRLRRAVGISGYIRRVEMVAQDVVFAEMLEGDKQLCNFLGKAVGIFLAGTSCGRLIDAFMDKGRQNRNEELHQEFLPCPCLDCVANVPKR